MAAGGLANRAGATRGGRPARGGRPVQASGLARPPTASGSGSTPGTAQAGALVIRGPREAIDLPDGSALAILRLDGGGRRGAR